MVRYSVSKSFHQRATFLAQPQEIYGHTVDIKIFIFSTLAIEPWSTFYWMKPRKSMEVCRWLVRMLVALRTLMSLLMHINFVMIFPTPCNTILSTKGNAIGNHLSCSDLGCTIKVIGSCPELDRETRAFRLLKDYQEGDLFTTYSTLASKTQKKNRLERIITFTTSGTATVQKRVTNGP